MGVKTDNLPSASVVKEVVAHVETAGVKSLATIPVEKLVAQVGASLGAEYSTLAELQADLDWNAGALAKVWGDAVLSNRGVYQKSGDVGAGAWTRIGPLPETDLSRSIRVPVGESINPFPDAATRAGTVLIFDPAGQPTSGPTAAQISSAEAEAAAAAADRAAADIAATNAANDAAAAAQSAIDAQNTVLGNAASIDFAPAGSITANKVQTAIEELDGDVQALASSAASAAALASTDATVAALGTTVTGVGAKADENERIAKNWEQTHVTATASYGPNADTELTALTATINNVAAASAVEINISVSIERASGEDSCLYIKRNGTEVGSAPSAGARPHGLVPLLYDSDSASTMTVISFTFIDTAPDTGANAYTFHIRGSTAQTSFLNRTISDTDTANFERATSTVILKELAQ